MEKRTPPPAQKEIRVTTITDGILELSVPPVGFISYLVLGSNRAAVIDTGMGVGSLRKEVEKLTALPVFVINTHGHPDHAGGNIEFEETYINPAEYDVFEKMATLEFRQADISHMPGGEELAKQLQPTPPLPKPLSDGEVFDLGGRTLRIVFAPGHTHGSIAILDEKTGYLFTGDNAMGRNTSMHEWNSSTIAEYRETLLKLKALNPQKLLCGHRPNVNEPEVLDRHLRILDRILSGEKGEERPMRSGGVAFFLEDSGSVFDYTPDHLG